MVSLHLDDPKCSAANRGAEAEILRLFKFWFLKAVSLSMLSDVNIFGIPVGIPLSNLRPLSFAKLTQNPVQKQ